MVQKAELKTSEAKKAKRKILYISGTRADYGLMRSVLFAIRDHPLLHVEIIATGMHLMSEFGNTVNDIHADGFRCHVVNAVYENDNRQSMASFIGAFIQGLTQNVTKIKPDIILIIGDRGEMLAAAIVGAYIGIPVAHLHGGEVTSTVDEVTRHAITKLSHIHLPATTQSGNRIRKMGEDPSHIHVVGAPGLDMLTMKRNRKELCARLNFDPGKPFAILLQHPVSLEEKDSSSQMRETLDAIKERELQTVVIYPNADAGGRRMISVIDDYAVVPYLRIFKSISHHDFLDLLCCADVILGNSSSAIIEAPTLKLPAVNIGMRQGGRERSDNVIDAPYKKEKILQAIDQALAPGFRSGLSSQNPYGDGRTGQRIADLLAQLQINDALLQKHITY